jgi:hypothetical protein
MTDKLVADPILPVETQATGEGDAAQAANTADATQVAQSALADQPEAASAEVQPSAPEASVETIPEKFRGKSAQEIARSYAELESLYGRVSSERAQAQREAEELRARLRAYASAQEQVPKEDPHGQAANLALHELVEKRWHDDPLDAVKTGFQELEARVRRENAMRQRAAAEADTSEYIASLMRENQDFADLAQKGVLREVTARFANLPDEYKLSRQFVDTVYKIAQAERIEARVKAEVEKQKKLAGVVTQEKRQAGGLAPAHYSDDTRSFAELSLEEMRARLPKIER